ncbi:hypothetical protein IAR55_005283 [Kwoniella newhampshirensis]|uniref:Uncharacterized protein n=1 Tax=Kwoniella newhampshirensis TaxID=1651941 RepID=A0AAW0YH30_9TREE
MVGFKDEPETIASPGTSYGDGEGSSSSSILSGASTDHLGRHRHRRARPKRRASSKYNPSRYYRPSGVDGPTSGSTDEASSVERDESSVEREYKWSERKSPPKSHFDSPSTGPRTDWDRLDDLTLTFIDENGQEREIPQDYVRTRLRRLASDSDRNRVENEQWRRMEDEGHRPVVMEETSAGSENDSRSGRGGTLSDGGLEWASAFTFHDRTTTRTRDRRQDPGTSTTFRAGDEGSDTRGRSQSRFQATVSDGEEDQQEAQEEEEEGTTK